MTPLSLMGLMFSIGIACAEFAQEVMQEMEAGGNTVDEGQYYGSDSMESEAAGLMHQTSLMIGLWAAGVDLSSPPAQEMAEAIEEVFDEPEAAFVAAELGCHSNSDCPSGFACVFSPGAEEGTCIKIGEIGVRIVGVIDGVTCAYCMTQIGRTGALDSMPIPPFHKHCRCSLEYLECGEE